MRISRLFAMSIAALSVGMSLPMRASGAGSGEVELSDLDARGKQLRAEIDGRRQYLVRTNTFRAGFRNNDITDIVERFVPAGMSFDDAEQILRAAGFVVESRPAASVPGNDPNRFNVTGSIKFYGRKGPFLPMVYIFVSLSPKAPGDYSAVCGVSGAIGTSYL
jgi:hypothetical protein